MCIRLIVTFWAGLAAAAVMAEDQVILPGARKVIDAAQFESLQAALDAVPEEGGLVRLPPGNFELHQPLVLRRGHTRLEGAGAATNLINRNKQGQPALVLQHPAGAAVKQDERLWRIQLSNFRITGNDQSGHGILAVQIEEIFLQGLTITGSGGDGIRLDHCYEDPRISDCLITYNRQVGIHLIGCHDIVVSANQLEENMDALHCIDGFNLCMTGNCLDDHLGRGVLIENTYGSVLSGNMIEECAAAAITLARDCYGITVAANVIAHNGAGVDLQDAHGCAVSANTFTIMKTDALKVGPDSGRITITGNNFSNSFIGEQKVKRAENDLAAAGLVLEGTQDVVISGNLFSGLRPKAVELRGPESRDVVVAGNHSVDAPGDLDQEED